MKNNRNLHVIEKPSIEIFGVSAYGKSEIVYQIECFLASRNIHITNDEKIEEGDWCMSLCDDESYGEIYQCKDVSLVDEEDKKIVLTTDFNKQPRVQPIEVEFLEWFVKNPSCEEVEINKIYNDYGETDIFDLVCTSHSFKYKIIIPKEDIPKEDYIKQIIELTMDQFVMDHETSAHGITHWQEVEKNAIMLAVQPDVDMTVVRLFAYFHDCKRVEEYEDYEHGERAAAFVKECWDSGKLTFLTSQQYNLLWFACNEHNKGSISDNPTVGACFDADRIELLRCRIVPRPELMSTPIGKRMAEKFQFINGSY